MVSPAASLPQTDIEVPEPHNGEPAIAPKQNVNVGEIERVVSVLLGSLLVANGIKRLSLFGLGIAGAGAALVQRGVTGQCGAYKAMHVTTADDGGKMLSHPLHQTIRVEKSVTVAKPAAEVYKFWRDFENLPTFMDHLESVKKIDDKRSHWVARAPRGKTVEWNADIVEEEENRKIAWKSVEGADVPNAGQVLFEEVGEGRGTRVTVVLSYDPPAGVIGAMFAKLFGEEPSQTVMEDLRRFKQIMETGEAPSTKG